MTHIISAREPSLPPRLRRRAPFLVASLALPILGVLICAVCVPGSERRGGEMFSAGWMACLFSLVGGAMAGAILAVVAILRREFPRALAVVSLVLNATIVLYAYS